jgi:flagellar basal-body rod protein FlgG
MMRALFTGASGMQGQQFRIDVTANNLANANTVGFKSDRAEFEDLLYQTLRTPGGTSATGTQFPTGLLVGLGVRPVATAKDFSQGSLVETSAPLDIAIEGPGFFEITLPDGTSAYTRAGSFKMDSTGQLLTPDGFPLVPNITIPPDAMNVTVSVDGNVFVQTPGATAQTNVGQLTLVRFQNPQGLLPMGSSYFVETGASGAPISDIPGNNGFGYLRQGYTETSNVSIVEEMIQLIMGQRAYEANSKSVTTSDQMLETAVNVKR